MKTNAEHPALTKTPKPFYRASNNSWSYRYEGLNGSIVLTENNMFASSSELQSVAEAMFGKGEPHNLPLPQVQAGERVRPDGNVASD